MTTPLNELLARTLTGITRAYESVDAGAPSLPLLMVADGEATMSKRAWVTLSKQLAKSPPNRERGRAALVAAEKKFASLRAPLAALVDKFELELPHYWLSYGTADPSVTGGRYRPGSEGPPRLPPHGADWSPVLRTGKGARELPITALLGQALCNFALDYEIKGASLGWTVLTTLPIDPKKGTPFKSLLRSADLSGDGRAGPERHGVVVVTDGIARLTDIGKRIRAGYAAHAAAVEDRWRAVYGDAAVTKVRVALEKLAPAGPAHPKLRWVPTLQEASIPLGM